MAFRRTCCIHCRPPAGHDHMHHRTRGKTMDTLSLRHRARGILWKYPLRASSSCSLSHIRLCFATGGIRSERCKVWQADPSALILPWKSQTVFHRWIRSISEPGQTQVPVRKLTDGTGPCTVHRYHRPAQAIEYYFPARRTRGDIPGTNQTAMCFFRIFEFR